MEIISFLGDVFLNDHVKYDIQLPGEFVFNLEGPVTLSENPIGGKTCLKMSPGCIDRAFKKLPIAVCLANNHILDFGVAGYLDTLRHLDDRGIKYFGCGSLNERCNNPLLIKFDDVVVAFAGYVCPSTNPVFVIQGSPGVAPIDLEWINQDITSARLQGAQIVVICLHWGVEEVEYVRLDDFDIAMGLFAMGADLIVGHHSHCVQPILIHQNKYSFFGLGNAVFPDLDDCTTNNGCWTKFRSWNNHSLLVHYNLTENRIKWRTQVLQENKVVCSKISNRTPPLLAESDRSRINKKFRVHSVYSRWRYALSRFIARPSFSKIKIKTLLNLFYKKYKI